MKMKIKDLFSKYYKEILTFILIFSVGLCLIIFYKMDPDYLWHIKAGDYMLTNGILRHDIFSWSVNSKYWMSHEWLFEISISTLKKVFGNFHVIIYLLLSIILLNTIFYFTNKDNYKKNIIFTLFWIVLEFILMFFIQCRPHLISYSFIALTMWMLYDLYNNQESKKIYFLPLLTIIWSNFHGGSSNLGYLLCFSFLIIGLFNFKFSKIEIKRLSYLQIKKYLICGVISVLCTCINVHGIRMLYYPYINILDSTMINNISEWQPTVLSNTSHYAFFGLALVVLLVLIFSKKKIRFIDFFIFGLGLFLGLKSIRFWPYLYIMCYYFIFNYVNEKKVNLIYINYFIISFICLGLFIFNINRVYINSTNNYLYLDNNIINCLKKEKPKRLYNSYDYGGELIHNDISVFIDGRADLYSSHKLYNDYLDIYYLRNNSLKLIDKYDFDYFLISNKSRLYDYLEFNDNYEEIAGYKDIYLYKKTS